MATRLAFTAISRARPQPLRISSALKAPARCFNPHAYPHRGVAAAHISSSACSRKSTSRAASGESNTAPSSTASAATAAAPASTTKGSGSITVGANAAGAGAQGGSEAAADPSTGSDPSDSNSSTDGGGGGGGGGGDGGSRGPLTWGAVGLLGIVATLAVGFYRMKWEEKQNRTASEVGSLGVLMCYRAERSHVNRGLTHSLPAVAGLPTAVGSVCIFCLVYPGTMNDHNTFFINSNLHLLLVVPLVSVFFLALHSRVTSAGRLFCRTFVFVFVLCKATAVSTQIEFQQTNT